MIKTDGFEQFSQERETLRWYDPEAVARVGREQSGLEHIRALIGGRLPPAPFMAMLQCDIVTAEPGVVTLQCTPSARHYNPMGAVHGGLGASLIDSASGLAVYSLLSSSDHWTTIDLRIDYLRPMTRATGATTCTGRVVRAGRRIGVADADVIDADGKLIARGTSTCIIMRGADS